MRDGKFRRAQSNNPGPEGRGGHAHPARCAFFPLCALLTFLCVTSPALAHRVHLFAYVNGDAIVADCRFSKNRPAQNAAVTAYDAESGKELFRGTSDSTGAARLTIPPEILRQPVNLRLVLNAGEGHQAEWLIEAEAIRPPAALPENSTAPAEPAPENAVSVPDTEAVTQKIHSTACSPAELEVLLNRTLDDKLAPIQALLAAQVAASQAKGPGFTEIVGGLGWLAGIFGGLAFWQSRKHHKEES